MIITQLMHINTDWTQVERSRRVHLNDLEFLVPYFFIGAVYMTTLPDPQTANNIFKVKDRMNY